VREKDLPARNIHAERRLGRQFWGVLAGIAASALLGATFWSANLTMEGPLRRISAWISSDENVVSQPPAFSGTTADAERFEIDDQQLESTSSVGLLVASPGRNPREGTAELISGGHPARTYSAGALLANGALLSEIHSGHVVLSFAGKTAMVRVGESLVLDEVSDEQQQSARATLAPSQEPLTEVLRPSAVFGAGGEILGYRILPGRDSAAFSRTGLQPGDVVVAIDRVPMREAAGIEQLRQLIQVPGIVATVRRNGRTEEIAINSEHT
jgi:hypothetical protein